MFNFNLVSANIRIYTKPLSTRICTRYIIFYKNSEPHIKLTTSSCNPKMSFVLRVDKKRKNIDPAQLFISYF